MDRFSDAVKGAPEIPIERVHWALEHACRVDQLSFKVWSIIFTSCAILASAARLFVRYLRERTFLLEEYLILLATICFVVEAGLTYSFIPSIYLIDATTFQRPVLKHIAQSADGTSGRDLQERFMSIGAGTVNAYFLFGWLAIFSIKASFLSLFYRMLRNVNKKLMTWFWTTVGFTIISAGAVLLESFQLCSHFGEGPVQCFLTTRHTFTIHSGLVVQSLDIITDLMVISIPVLLLRMSSLRLQLKLRLVLILCLSTACVVIGIIRMAGGVHFNVVSNKQFSMVWLTFMLHCEAAVALMAGSVPGLHALITAQELNVKQRLTASRSDGGKSSRESNARDLNETVETPGGPLRAYEEEKTHSVNRWRNSVVNFIPARMGSNRSRRLLGTHRRNDSTDSGVIHPILAYHKFGGKKRINHRVMRSSKI
ncbi:hypothetical protein DM02DRAFT_668070 [Periconia macrospinosa]|uniref:Rhodopsin domain-containing protein n=1 Tax=Periconia macrospinosa TaxID=97972 RepID=A0A2V1E6J0_9PLEO|nr:hypothetical protein DM02DRAFT_668070 [Periconia macrospinosa]